MVTSNVYVWLRLRCWTSQKRLTKNYDKWSDTVFKLIQHCQLGKNGCKIDMIREKSIDGIKPTHMQISFD